MAITTSLVRALAAFGVLASAEVHLELWAEGFRSISVVGPMFLLNVIAGAAIAMLLLAWPSWVPPLLAVGFGAATLGAFIIAATVGLFSVHETWNGIPQQLAAAGEITAIVAGLTCLALLVRQQPAQAHGARWLART